MTTRMIPCPIENDMFVRDPAINHNWPACIFRICGAGDRTSTFYVQPTNQSNNQSVSQPARHTDRQTDRQTANLPINQSYFWILKRVHLQNSSNSSSVVSFAHFDFSIVFNHCIERYTIHTRAQCKMYNHWKRRKKTYVNEPANRSLI